MVRRLVGKKIGMRDRVMVKVRRVMMVNAKSSEDHCGSCKKARRVMVGHAKSQANHDGSCPEIGESW